MTSELSAPPAVAPEGSAAALDQLEQFLKGKLPKEFQVSHREEPPALVVMRDGCTDLVIRKNRNGFEATSYVFISSGVLSVLVEALRESPVTVQIVGSHMRPEGR